jgi:hypothetical protein
MVIKHKANKEKEMETGDVSLRMTATVKKRKKMIQTEMTAFFFIGSHPVCETIKECV